MNEYKIKKAGKKNKGYLHKRTKSDHSIIEKVLSDSWRHKNKTCPGMNSGQGILQDLFVINDNRNASNGYFLLTVTRRERFIVATVIQWLGTNCGFSFLKNAMEKAGYSIIKNEQK